MVNIRMVAIYNTAASTLGLRYRFPFLYVQLYW